jgi:dTDP-4-dehydrorhamnose 3,5-epimerase
MVDDSEVYYRISDFYYPEAAKGIRWDDPLFGVQ